MFSELGFDALNALAALLGFTGVCLGIWSICRERCTRPRCPADPNMVTRRFDVTWPSTNGPLWLNQDNLLRCLTHACPGTRFVVHDMTGDRSYDFVVGASPPDDRRYLSARIRGAMARGYTTPDNADKVLDPVLCEAMAQAVLLELASVCCRPRV